MAFCKKMRFDIIGSKKQKVDMWMEMENRVSKSDGKLIAEIIFPKSEFSMDWLEEFLGSWEIIYTAMDSFIGLGCVNSMKNLNP